MTNLSISTASIQSILTSQLVAEQSNLETLNEQLATSKQYTDLTDYAPSDALNLLNLQSSATQRQAYLSVIGTVQTRLSGYDTTMTDMESIVSQAQTLASGNPNYSASSATGIASLAQNFLKSISVDLDTQIGGRYIYAGSRYNTAPVVDLTTLTGTPSSTIYTDGSSLPDYDTDSTASALTMTVAGQDVTIGGTPGTPQNATVTINNKTYSYAVQSTDTTDDIATGLAALVAADIPGTTATGSDITVGATGTITGATAATSNTAAYAVDSTNIDSNYNVQYGVTSNNPAFQQLIAGLQFLAAAGNSTDAATYQSNITQASSLLSTALTSLQGVHATVANNINTMTNETTTQNNDINDITNQIDNIQQVDLTQVSTELTLLETQLQASYSATGSLEKLSIVNYL